MKIRALFLGTPDFAKAHLQALIDSDLYEVVGVVSQPDRPSGRKMKLQASPVKALAEEHQLPVITPESLRKQPETLDQFKQWKPDVLIVVAFGQILPSSYLDAFPGKVVNVHGSLLPRWRGAAPIQRAITEGDKITGVCLQVMVPALDAGDVIGEREMEITHELNAIDLHEQMKPLGIELLMKDLPAYLDGQVTPKPQDESLVTYAKKIEKAEAFIDWSKSAEQIFNQYKGLMLGPGVKGVLDGKVYKFTSMDLKDKKSSGIQGKTVSVEKDHFKIQTASGQIEIWEIQPESKRRMSVEEFLKGYELSEGDVWKNS